MTKTSLGLLFVLLLAGCGRKKDEPSSAAASDEKSRPAASASAASTPAPLNPDTLTMPRLPEMPVPADNPQTEAKIALGHQLFFDKRLSVDGSVACYSCHQNEHGNGGATPLAVGALGKQLTRHSPVIWNVGFLGAFYWDGRTPTLEAQALGAWGGGNMGVGKEHLDKKATELAKIPGYGAAFEKAFPGEAVTANTVAQALAAYERTLVCGDTAYDRYAAGDKTALTSAQKDGLSLFMGKAMCATCHAPPHFSSGYLGDGAYFNVGIGTRDASGAPLPKDQVDPGRMAASKQESDFAAFKPPSLRNVQKSAPYFHDGSVASLREAVKLMAEGGYENPARSPLAFDKKLTDAELDSLVTFLGALDCSGSLEEPKLP